MDNGRIVFALVAAFFASSAAAEPTVIETQPIEGDAFRDFRIDECGDTYGMVTYHYYSQNSGTSFELSDFCLDEEGGVLLSSEERGGFELVAKGRNGRRFEDLSSGDDEHSRYSIELNTYESIWGCSQPDINSHTFQYRTGKGRSRRFPDHYLTFSSGYTIDKMSGDFENASSLDQQYVIFMPLSVDGREWDVAAADGSLISHFTGTSAISFDSGEGVLSFIEGDGSDAGEMGGSLNVVREGVGGIFLSGNITASNARLAGHQPTEWISLNADVPYMRGHILGKNGEVLHASGLVIGNFEDASGASHTFRANLLLFGCGQ